MTAEIYQIRDYQRPEERIACDKRVDGIPLIELTDDDMRTIEQWAMERSNIPQAPTDSDPQDCA